MCVCKFNNCPVKWVLVHSHTNVNTIKIKTEHFHHPEKFLLCPSQSILFPALISGKVSHWYFFISGTIRYAFLCFWLLSCSMLFFFYFLKFSHIVTCIRHMFLFISKYIWFYRFATLVYHICWWSFFVSSLWLLWINMLWISVDK